MSRMTKSDRVKAYNANNPGYYVTDIKKMSRDDIQRRRTSAYSYKSLEEAYKKPSHAKIDTYNELIDRYKPHEIIQVSASSHHYSVLLKADNGDIFHITHGNNYLVEVQSK